MRRYQPNSTATDLTPVFHPAQAGVPGRDGLAGVVEAEEQRLVQELVSHAPVEALADAVLHRLARCDEVPSDLVLACPAEHGVGGELGAVVGDDHRRATAAGEKSGQL